MKENCQIEYSVLPKYFRLYTTKERSYTRPMLPQNDDSGGWAVMILWQASQDHIGCGNFKWRIYLKIIKLLNTLLKFTSRRHEQSTLYQDLFKHYLRGYLFKICTILSEVHALVKALNTVITFKEDGGGTFTELWNHSYPAFSPLNVLFKEWF